MQFPLSTGQVAGLVKVTEPRINDLIRRAKLDTAPPVAGGRRLWFRDHITSLVETLRQRGHNIHLNTLGLEGDAS